MQVVCLLTYQSHSGWYRPLAFDMIKSLLRLTYTYLRDTGARPPQDMMDELTDAYEQAVTASTDKDAAESFGRRLATIRRAAGLAK